MKKFQCRTILGILVCLGGFLGLAKPAFASTELHFQNSISWDGYSTVFQSGQASRILPASYSRTDEYISWVASSSQPVGNKNEDFIATTAIVTRVPYSQNNTPRPVTITCPITTWRLNTSNCQTSTTENVFGNWHYVIYNFTITGQLTDDVNASQFMARISIKNFSDEQGDIWFTPMIVSIQQGQLWQTGLLRYGLDNVKNVLDSIDTEIASQTTIMSNLYSSLQTTNNYLYDIRRYTGDAAQNTYNQSQDMSDMKEAIEDQNDKENEAVDNISDQTPSDISDSTSSQTTSLISTISGFFSALGNIQTGSCQLTLNFPEYAGGTQVVNPCSAKEDSNSSSVITIINFASSVVALLFFVPLSLVLLRLIFGEIRSWTNG